MVSIEHSKWIFIDDGSDDSSREIIRTFCESTVSKNVKFAANDINLGKAETLRRGFIESLNQSFGAPRVESHQFLIGFLDADGAFKKEDVVALLELARSASRAENKKYNAYWSSRVKLNGHEIERNAFRHLIGRVIRGIISLSMKNLPYDTQCGFKLFEASPSLKLCLADEFKTKWFFELELVSRDKSINGTSIEIYEYPLKYWREMKGSKLKITSAVEVTKEVTYILWNSFRTRKIV